MMSAHYGNTEAEAVPADASAASNEDFLRTLEVVMRPLVHMAIEQKVPYSQMDSILKVLYFDESWRVALARKLVPSRVLLCGLSGMGIGDIKKLWARGSENFRIQLRQRDIEMSSDLTPAAIVAAEWMARGWPLKIPVRGRDQSLSKLRALISVHDARFKSISLRLLYDDLQRGGVIKRDGPNIVLVNPVGVQKSSGIDRSALLHVAGAAGDHLRAIVANLAGLDRQERFLEQSLSVDGLTDEGARRLHKLARIWWTRMAARFGKHSLHELEAQPGGDARHRLRFGVYFFSEPEGANGHEVGAKVKG